MSVFVSVCVVRDTDPKGIIIFKSIFSSPPNQYPTIKILILIIFWVIFNYLDFHHELIGIIFYV